jgi:hypothetical protein
MRDRHGFLPDIASSLSNNLLIDERDNLVLLDVLPIYEDNHESTRLINKDFDEYSRQACVDACNKIISFTSKR